MTAEELNRRLREGARAAVVYEERLAAIAEKVLAEYGNIAARAFEEAVTDHALAAAASWNPPHPDEVLDVEAVVGSLRGRSDPVRRKAIEAVMGPALAGSGIDFDLTNPFVNGVLSSTGAKITNIGETTRAQVMRLVRRSYEEGLSIPDTSKAIRASMKEASAWRGRMIARTEMVGLVNGGALAAAEIVSDETGTKYVKVWLTAAGAEYPRHETYPGLHGQKRPMKEPFSVGGNPMQYPGDPNGPAGETINCRCSVIHEEVEKDEAEIEGELLAPPAPLERPSWAQSLTRLAGVRKQDVVEGRVPALTYDRRVSKLPAKFFGDRILVGDNGFLADGTIDTIAIGREGGRNIAQRLLSEFADAEGGVPPELLALRRTRTRYDNPFGRSYKPEEILSDAYSDILHGVNETRTDARALAVYRRVQEKAREMGMPAEAFYRYDSDLGRWVSNGRTWEPPTELIPAKLVGALPELKTPAAPGSTVADWEDLRPLTQDEVERKMQAVVDDFRAHYGLEGRNLARYEPEATAAWETEARTLIPTGRSEQEIWYGAQIMDRARDPTLGVFPFRQIAHEAAHTINPERSLPGFAADFEEGAAELLSLRYWAERGQPFDARDAVRVEGRWTDPGFESLAHSVAYREQTAEIIRRAASKVGWDRALIEREVLDVMKGDHYARLRFRDATDARFAPPPGVDEDAPSLVRWFLGEEPGAGAVAEVEEAGARAAMPRWRQAVEDQRHREWVGANEIRSVLADDPGEAFRQGYYREPVVSGADVKPAPGRIMEEQEEIVRKVGGEVADEIDRRAAILTGERLADLPARQAAADAVYSDKIKESSAAYAELVQLGKRQDAAELELRTRLKAEYAARYPDKAEWEITRLAREDPRYVEAAEREGAVMNLQRAHWRATKDAEKEAREARKAIEGEAMEIQREATMEVLEEIRPIGPASVEEGITYTTKGRRGQAKVLLDQASALVPRAWIERMQSAPLKVSYSRNGRGKHWDAQLGDPSRILLSGYDRSKIASDPEGFCVALHELMHHVEEVDDRVRALQWTFYQRRTRGNSLDAPQEDGRRYDGGTFREDEFLDSYMGKTYGNSPNSHYEVLTMGLESLLTGSHDLDPDMRRFVLGLLALL